MIAVKAKHTQTSYFGQKPQIFYRKGVPNCNFDLIKDFFLGISFNYAVATS